MSLRNRAIRFRPRIAVATLLVVMLVALFVPSAESGAATKSTVRLFGFDAGEPPWVVVNDGVMGGRSTGRVARRNGILTFRGRVSLQNNGGFASTRSNSPVPRLAVGSRAFVLRVRGDGALYQFTVDTADGWYWSPIQPTKGAWQTIRIPFSSLQPVTRFGERTGRPGFDGSQAVTSTGVLIANKRAEQFTLSLDWIDADNTLSAE